MNYDKRYIEIKLHPCPYSFASEHPFVLLFGAEIFVDDSDEEEEKLVSVGYITGCVFLGSKADGEAIIDCADSIDQEVYDAAFAAFNEEWGIPDAENVLFIERLFVDEEHRGHGVGTVALALFQWHVGYGCDTIILQPQPIEKVNGVVAPLKKDHPDLLERKKKLESYYSQLGFCRVSEDSDFMFYEHQLMDQLYD